MATYIEFDNTTSNCLTVYRRPTNIFWIINIDSFNTNFKVTSLSMYKCFVIYTQLMHLYLKKISSICS